MLAAVLSIDCDLFLPAMAYTVNNMGFAEQIVLLSGLLLRAAHKLTESSNSFTFLRSSE